MTLEDAIHSCIHYKLLTGTQFKGDEISQLVLVPNDAKKIKSFILKAAHNIPYDQLLFGFDDFTIVALLNMHDYPFNSPLKWCYLDDILKEANPT